MLLLYVFENFSWFYNFLLINVYLLIRMTSTLNSDHSLIIWNKMMNINIYHVNDRIFSSIKNMLHYLSQLKNIFDHDEFQNMNTNIVIELIENSHDKNYNLMLFYKFSKVNIHNFNNWKLFSTYKHNWKIIEKRHITAKKNQKVI